MIEFGVCNFTSTQSFTERQQYAFVCQTVSGQAAPSPEDAKLDQLATRRAGWDGHGSSAPSVHAINVARVWLDHLKAVTARSGSPWVRPLINSSAEAEVTLEWWSGARKLTLYFAQSGAEYIRVWGPDIDNNMDSGELTNSDEFRDLWNWLHR